MDIFQTNYDRLMNMKKAEIIAEGQLRGFWSDRQSNADELMKWKKKLLCRKLADRITRWELRGY